MGSEGIKFNCLSDRHCLSPFLALFCHQYKVHIHCHHYTQFSKYPFLFIIVQKERDLELAARIGQSLLKQNQELTERNEMLDEQLEIAKEEV